MINLSHLIRYSYSGYVTQLAGGSEVAIIGILFQFSGLTEAWLLDFYIYTDDLAAGKSFVAVINNANSENIQKVIATLDNQALVYIPAVSADKTAQTADTLGIKLPFPMGNYQRFYVYCNDTLDATKKIYARIEYAARGMVTPSAVGAGITLTEGYHKSC